MAIVLRAQKGAPLSFEEADGNTAELDTRTALGWRDNVTQFIIGSSPNDPAMTQFRGGVFVPALDPGVEMSGFAYFHVDHDYALGTKLYPHIHWSVDTTDVATVRWGIEYSVAKGHQQQAFPVTTTVYVEQATTGTPYMHYVAEVSDTDAIDGAALGIEPDTLIIVRVFRDGAHANDTFPDVVYGLCLDLHYQADRATTPYKRPNFLTGA